LAAADSRITVRTKYHYNFWRPVTAIREGTTTAAGTVGDRMSRSHDSPYPDHSSGANNFTAAITTILQLFFKTDEFDYTVSSTALNLLTNPRTYTRFSQAQQEVVDVRVYQGIHFRFADEDGRQGCPWGTGFQKFLRPSLAERNDQ
jgi:hypothetical protein